MIALKHRRPSAGLAPIPYDEIPPRPRQRWTEIEIWMYLVRVTAVMLIAIILGWIIPAASMVCIVIGGLLCLGEAIL
ncbi:MAG: hypothetical protein KBC95_00350 [Candidatus Peribacteraceae bacterium]|nr:hypothetical protein [Candidatus Peribacteraceae bacterium]